MAVTLYGDAPVVKQWMSERFGGPVPKEYCSTIALVEGNEIKGAVWLENYNGASVYAHVVGDGRRWLTRQFMTDFFHYVFNVLECKKIIGIVREVNTDAQRFDEHLGFKREAVIEDADPEGAIFIYSLRREDCRYLRKV
jgi:hypothetical protein